MPPPRRAAAATTVDGKAKAKKFQSSKKKENEEVSLDDDFVVEKKKTGKRKGGRKEKQPQPGENQSVLRELGSHLRNAAAADSLFSAESPSSEDLSFKHRLDSTFDRLFTGNSRKPIPPKRVVASAAYNHSPSFSDKSSSGLSGPVDNASTSPEVLLFQSIVEEEEDWEKEEEKKRQEKEEEKKRKRQQQQQKKKTENKEDDKISPPTDRVFSDETLAHQANYVRPAAPVRKGLASKTTGDLLESPGVGLYRSRDLFSSQEVDTDDDVDRRKEDSEVLNCQSAHVSLVSNISNLSTAQEEGGEEEEQECSSFFRRSGVVTSTPALSTVTERRRKKEEEEEEGKRKVDSDEGRVEKGVGLFDSLQEGEGFEGWKDVEQPSKDLVELSAEEEEIGNEKGYEDASEDVEGTKEVGESGDETTDEAGDEQNFVKFQNRDLLQQKQEVSDEVSDVVVPQFTKAKSRKTVRIGGFQERELSDQLSGCLSLGDSSGGRKSGKEEEEEEEEDVLGSSIVAVVKGGKNWRRTFFRANILEDGYNRKTLAFFGNHSSSSPAAMKPPGERLFRRTTIVHLPLSAAELRPATDLSGRSLLQNASSSEPVCYTRHYRSSIIVPIPTKEDSEIHDDESYIKNASIICEPTASTVEKVLSRCTRKEIVQFHQLFDEGVLEEAKKLGEGSYGEVFLLPRLFQQQHQLSLLPPPVLKIVPVDGQASINGDVQTRLEDMLGEIVVSTELSRISQIGLAPNFVQVLECYLTEGSYPSRLLNLWDEFDAERGSQNDRPDSSLLPSDQRFMVLVYTNGGSDLEATTLGNGAKGMAVFMQVAHALAVAEEVLQFEHRDLHWGNILVDSTEEKSISYRLGDLSYEVKTEKVKATIIDFTLSRLTSNEDRCVVSNDLSKDPDLFKAKGDYQFDIYRMMKKEVKSNWQDFTPKTNIFWLHYLLDKLIASVPYKLTTSQTHKKGMAALRKMKSKILTFDSASHFVREEGTLLE